MRNAPGDEAPARLTQTLTLNDPSAMREAALLGLGVTLLMVSDALPWIERGELIRLLPDGYADAGAICVYYPTRALLPAKTRVFVDYRLEAFERDGLARRFAGNTH